MDIPRTNAIRLRMFAVDKKYIKAEHEFLCLNLPADNLGSLKKFSDYDRNRLRIIDDLIFYQRNDLIYTKMIVRTRRNMIKP